MAPPGAVLKVADAIGEVNDVYRAESTISGLFRTFQVHPNDCGGFNAH
jgi:hypothetical protein